MRAPSYIAGFTRGASGIEQEKFSEIPQLLSLSASNSFHTESSAPRADALTRSCCNVGARFVAGLKPALPERATTLSINLLECPGCTTSLIRSKFIREVSPV